MGKSRNNSSKRRDKRKKSSSSGDESVYQCKQLKHGGPSEWVENQDETVTVSHLLSEANSVLFEDSVLEEGVSDSDLKFAASEKANLITMASKTDSCETSSPVQSSPSNSDIIAFLKRIDSRIEKVEVKLQKLDNLEEKVVSFENEMKKLWLHVDKSNKAINEKVTKLDERMDNAEMQDGIQSSKLQQLENENAKLKDSISYLQSQSMRNNLVFCNIEEQVNEKPADTEAILRRFMVDKLKMAEEQVTAMKIERAHRMGPISGARGNSVRKIVCKFNDFKDREVVRQKRSELRGSNIFVHEQFPPEIVARRKALMPHLKKARQENKNAWISYDTLYIEGRPVKID